MIIDILKKQIEKLYLGSKKVYTDDSWLTQDEIDRIIEIANKLQK